MNILKRSTLMFLCLLLGCSGLDKVGEEKRALSGLVQLERKVHQLINVHRISQNLPPLTMNETITQQARNHSRSMAKKKTPFGHNGFDKRVKRIARILPYTLAAENIAYNRGYPNCARNAVEGWLESPRHRKNIAGNYRLTGIGVGIGVAKGPQGDYYFTQIFWQE
jgi:uncharacterized protein YkwD